MTERVILATPLGRQKDGAIRQLLAENRSDAIVSNSPPPVPEENYNRLLAARPELIAALKVVQLLNQSDIGFSDVSTGAIYFEGATYALATDVVVDTRGSGDSWQAHHKLPKESGREGILTNLVEIFTPKSIGRLIEVRVRVGCAALALSQNENQSETRGVAGTVEHFLYVEPIPADELAQYVAETSEERLFSTNGGVSWDETFFEPRIMMIDGVGRDDPEFPKAKAMFLQSLYGAPVQLLDLLGRVSEFALGQSLGDLTADIRSAAAEFVGIEEPGNWCLWRPTRIEF